MFSIVEWSVKARLSSSLTFEKLLPSAYNIYKSKKCFSSRLRKRIPRGIIRSIGGLIICHSQVWKSSFEYYKYKWFPKLTFLSSGKSKAGNRFSLILGGFMVVCVAAGWRFHRFCFFIFAASVASSTERPWKWLPHFCAYCRHCRSHFQAENVFSEGNYVGFYTASTRCSRGIKIWPTYVHRSTGFLEGEDGGADFTT